MANTTIELRQSGSTGNTPSLGVLANGELAINRADGILYYKTSSNTLGSIRTTQPAGLTTEVQFNDAGSFGSTSQVTVNKTSGLLTATTFRASQSSGDEGGQIDLALAATNTSLTGNVAIDIYQNKLRIFETGGTNRGVYIDIANSAAAGVGTDLTSPAAIDSYARSKANSANITADAAYAWANTVNIKTDAAFTKANTANVTAEAAFSKSNSANVLAQAAFDKANSVTQQGFVTVAANGTNVVADANNDTLTISAANGVGITSNATTDTITFNLTPTGVTSGTYGSASIVPVFVVDAQGRLSSVTNTTIAISSSAVSGTFGFSSGGTNATSYTTGTLLTSNGTAIVSLANTGTAATYANASHVPVITTDAYGRVSSVTNTAIAIAASQITSGALPFARGGTNAASYTTGALLTSNGTAIISLANTGTAGTYGNSTFVPVITTDAYGRVSSVTNTAIVFPSDLANTGTSVTANGLTRYTFANTTPSTSTTTGAVIISGGLGVAGNIYANAIYDGGIEIIEFASQAFSKANTANVTAEAAFAKANTANITAEAAFNQANTANVTAQAAFNKANSAVANTGGSISGDLTITGNLTIIGQQVYANTQTVLIKDNIITLNAAIDQASAPSANAGLEIDRGSSANVYLLWNENSDVWQYTNDGTTYYTIADAATVTSAFNKANTANVTAEAAYAWANTINVFTQSSFTKANTANITAEAAFSKANSSNVLAQAAFDKANQTAQLAFTTVAANGTSLVADANNDTLTITANTANGIQILANATTDTLDIGLKPSGVTSGTYGNTSTAVTITIDQFGRITSVSQTAITAVETDPLALAYAIALG